MNINDISQFILQSKYYLVQKRATDSHEFTYENSPRLVYKTTQRNCVLKQNKQTNKNSQKKIFLPN